MMEGKHFDNAKVGDKVFDVMYKQGGRIKNISVDLLFIEFPECKDTLTYAYSGKLWTDGIADLKQTLFYVDEVEFVVKKRKKMVKKECVRYCNRPPSDLENGSTLFSCFAPTMDCHLKVMMSWEEEA